MLRNKLHNVIALTASIIVGFVIIIPTAGGGA